MSPTTPRRTADERRDDVIAAAQVEFALEGFEAATTEGIARRAGISQAYVFRLFGTKRDLFLATVEACHDRVQAVMRERADRAPVGDAQARLAAMGDGYRDLLAADPQQLVLQLHTYAASVNDPEIRAVAQRRYRGLWDAVSAMSGAGAEEVQAFFAHGMLMNVAAALDMPELAAPPSTAASRG
jgi:AcrR family transcriptional regulator